MFWSRSRLSAKALLLPNIHVAATLMLSETLKFLDCKQYSLTRCGTYTAIEFHINLASWHACCSLPGAWLHIQNICSSCTTLQVLFKQVYTKSFICVASRGRQHNFIASIHWHKLKSSSLHDADPMMFCGNNTICHICCIH